ncbi:MAG: hypothetical protein LBD88_05230 [Candidatus Peribacteria bacterium]|jgi:pyruvate,water dikinase|nr:hypothetical protein [Candidatus Peribacteria bacterium]
MKIYNLKKDKKIDISKIGGKALPIFEMIKSNFSVPSSFVIDSDFFEQHLKYINFWQKISIAKMRKTNELKKAQKLIIESHISRELKDKLSKIKNNIRFWAVRSSANVEDSKNNSWAGRFESFIGIKQKDLEQNIKKVWASVFRAKVISYLDDLKNIKKIKMSVLLQTAIDADVSGVLFTKDIFKNEENNLVIEAVNGIGEYLMQGEIIPDKYVVNKKSLVIVEIDFNEQKNKLSFSRKGFLSKSKNINVKKQKLSGGQIIELSKIAIKNEKIYKTAQDIEWCIKYGRFYLLQSRPITT